MPWNTERWWHRPLSGGNRTFPPGDTLATMYTTDLPPHTPGVSGSQNADSEQSPIGDGHTDVFNHPTTQHSRDGEVSHELSSSL